MRSGWCLGGASATSFESHLHAGRCAANPHPPYADGRKNYFGTQEQFDAAHQARASISQY